MLFIVSSAKIFAAIINHDRLANIKGTESCGKESSIPVE